MLSNISFIIKKGEFIGILGTYGSRKTTLLKSILNNYKVIDSLSPIIINGEINDKGIKILSEGLKNFYFI